MKKLMSLLLAAAMVASLAACSNTGSSASQPASQPASQAETAAPTTKEAAQPASQEATQAPTEAATAAPTEAPTAAPAPADVVSAKDTLNVQIAGDPGDLSPYGLWNNNGMRIKYQIMQSLFTTGPDSKPVAVLADDDYKWVDDKTIEFAIREGAHFSNGDPVTTEDVMYSLETAAANSIFSIQAKYVDLDATRASIKDDRHMSIVLKDPSAFFYTTVGALNISNKKSMEADPNAQKTNPIGSGPYKVKEYVVGSHVELEADENYWNKAVDGAKVKSVTCRFITEPAQRTISLEMGEVDFLWDVPSVDYETLKNEDGIEVLEKAGTNTLGLTLNVTENSILSDVRLREAIVTAIDAAAVTQVAYGEMGEPCYTLFTDGFTGVTGGAARYNKGVYCKADVASAKALVDAWSADNGGQTPKIVMMNNGDKVRGDALQVINSMLNNAGFEATIVDYEAAAYNQYQQDTKAGWDLFISSQGCPSGLIADYLNSLFGKDSQNRTGQQNQELFDIISEAIKIVDDEAKMTELMDRAIEIITQEQFYWVPLTQIKMVWAYNDALEGVVPWGPSSMRYADFYFTK